MKIVKFLVMAIVPAGVMAYGWYLGQLHMSGYDVAGILLFFTGLAGFGAGVILRYLMKNLSWRDRWYVSLLTGAAGCAVVFAVALAAARLHG